MKLVLFLFAVSLGLPAETTTVERWMRSLSLERKVGQLFMLPFYGDAPDSRSPDYRRLVRWVRERHIGGLVLVNRVENGIVRHTQPRAMAAFVNRMQRLSRLPLLVAGDFERSASMRVSDSTPFPHAMAFAATGDPETNRYLGRVTAREARALGIQWVFAPVADVNNNPDNPIINIRSYGEDPEQAAAYVRAFLEGARAVPANRVLTTAKHFPGHGDTAVDTHLGLATLEAERPRMDRVELVPFRAAIAAGVDAVMTAHLAAPALDASGVPATMSAPILTGVLRNELGFKGLIVTDALDMKGVAAQWSSAEIAVRALEAGADVLLMPVDPEEAYRAVLGAVRSGRLSRQRIDESVARILAAKVRAGLHRRRLVNLKAIAKNLGSPQDTARARQIAERAVTLVKNEGDLAPLVRPERACFLVLPEHRLSAQGKVFLEEVNKRTASASAVLLNPDADPAAAAAGLGECEAVVVAAFVSVAAYRGSVALAGNYPQLMRAILDTGRPVVLVALGNPYLLRSFPRVSAYLTTYSTTTTAEVAAVSALFGKIPIRGRLPVSIPGFAGIGEGIQVPARR